MKQGQIIGVIMDPVTQIKPAKDTTLALMRAAQERGLGLSYMEQDDIYIADGKVRARTKTLTLQDHPDQWYAMDDAHEDIEISALDAVFMRKDPPVDKRFIHCCYMLAQAQKNGARIINDPLALLRYNEKLYATCFPDFCPPYVVTSSRDILRDFAALHNDIIIKPLDEMGGSGVFLVKKNDVNLDVIWEIQTARGTYPVMAQKFVPDIAHGDKRVIIINGKPYGYALVRLPAEDSIRGNLAAGGSYDVRKLDESEYALAEKVGQKIVGDGVFLAGIDIIGDYLIEINITSPTGLRELSAATGDDVAGLVIDAL